MLDAAEDLEALVAAIKTSRQILSSREFSHLKPKEFRPGPKFRQMKIGRNISEQTPKRFIILLEHVNGCGRRRRGRF